MHIDGSFCSSLILSCQTIRTIDANPTTYCLCIETYQLRNMVGLTAKRLKNDLLHTNEILWVDTFFLSAARNVWRPEWRTSAVWCGHVPQKTREISTLKAGSFGETPFPSRAVWGTYLENIGEEWWRYWLCNLCGSQARHGWRLCFSYFIKFCFLGESAGYYGLFTDFVFCATLDVANFN